MNKSIEELRVEISKLISESQLPIGVVYYLMKDIMREITFLYDQQIQQEASKSEKSEE